MVYYFAYVPCILNKTMAYNEESQQTAHEQQDQTAGSAQAEQLAQVQQQLLYLKADMETMRRNAFREREAYARKEQERLLLSLLGVLDDLERGVEQLSSYGEKPETRGIVQGLAMIVQQCAKTFHDAGVREIETTGTFDPHHHEALGQQHIDGVEAGTIIQTLQKGYIYKDVVIRPAKVLVAA